MKRKILALLLAVTLFYGRVQAKPKNPYENWIACTVTAYCPCRECSEGYGRRTATGTVATAGRTIAVDPKRIPYGSTVLIYYEDILQGIYIAEDCGGAIKGSRIDLFFDTHRETEEWGVRKCKIVVFDGKG